MTVDVRAHAVQRVVLPYHGDLEAIDLYVRADPAALVSATRTGVTIAEGASVSFDTYFATFPAGYWLRHTDIRTVSLELRADGPITVTVRTVTADGSSTSQDHSGSGEIRIDVPLDPDCTRASFDVAAHDGATVDGIAWTTPGAAPGNAAICITTFDREADCLAVLERLAADAEVLAHVTRVIVVDQGGRRLSDHEDFDRVAALHGTRLEVIEQRNLGGSGGFSRGMIEALAAKADHALLLDDDVILEPESIRRMLAFAANARGRRIVGGHMLSLVDRTVLHSFGERVDRRRFWWRPVDSVLSEVDLAALAPSEAAAIDRVYDVDFNGWWMCLIPSEVVARVGASLPFFIKWDDAEYGLRAAAAGVETVTLPGAAIWHMPWTAKDDGLDWQAYYQLRNRMVTALLYSSRPRGGGILRSTFAQDVNHLLCLQYGSAAVRAVALGDILTGPDHLWRTLETRPAAIRGLLASLGQTVVPDTDLPMAVVQGAPPRPRGAARAAARLIRVLARQAWRTSLREDAPVERALTRSEGKWWALGLVDSATVTSATGRGAFVAVRDRRRAARGLWKAIILRIRLWVRWRALARAYRAALPELASVDVWQARFDGRG